MRYTQPRPYRTEALAVVPHEFGEFTGTVVQADFVAPILNWSGNDKGAEAIQDKLNADPVWRATVIPQTGEAVKGWFSTYYPNAHLRVTMKRRDGIAFSPDAAQDLVRKASASLGVLLSSFSEWTVTVLADAKSTAQDLAPGEVVRTAGSFWKKKLDEIKIIGLGPAFGLPGWFFPVVATVTVLGGGLFVAVKATDVKKAWFGEAPRRRKRRD